MTPTRQSDTGRGGAAEDEPRVWDLPVRIFHWTLVAAFLGAFVTDRMGVAYFRWHARCGYVVLVLVAFRLVWGVVGTRHARFRNFLRGPRAILRYALDVARGRAESHAGHNPLGALMVVALLLALGVEAVSGLFGNDEIVDVGPLYGSVSEALSLALTSLHRRLFYWIAAAVALHVAAVLAHRLLGGERLIRAMITGRKPQASVGPQDAIQGSRTWLAAAVVAVIAAVVVWVVAVAPIVFANN
jgi:cytochrome b